jgi:hypothetical protein
VPLRSQPNNHQYSNSDELSQDDDEKFFDNLIDAANRGDLSGEPTDAEILAAMDDPPKQRSGVTPEPAKQ